ncbi:MAG: secretion system protein E [Candidatus Omnitrophica bacterium]|nr:secretion system protein E [Candidatus Omnitrophota bacterium]
MSAPLTDKINDILLSRAMITEKDLEKAREIQARKGGGLPDILVDMGLLTRDDLLMAASEGMGFPPLRLSRMRIEKKVLDIVPRRMLMAHMMIPVALAGKRLTVAMVDPLNIFALDDLKMLTEYEVLPVVVDSEDLKETFARHFERSAGEEINTLVDGIRAGSVEVTGAEEEAASEAEIVEDAPVVKLVNLIMMEGVRAGASDILIEPMEDSSRVRYRIDGVLVEKYRPPRNFHFALISRVKVISNLDIAERRLPQDGRFRIKADDRQVDFRVSIIPSNLGEKAALRVLDKQQAMIDLDLLGFGERDKKVIREASSSPHGMILVCGPTGSGKTTTLYSILKHVDDPAKNLVTVEDPVEYELEGINQVSAREDIGLTFSSCLRSILRQDPDVIMIGEIRDTETLDIAVKSALTGHLVLSTLHTNTASGSIVRMVNMGIEPFLIASSVELIAAQRLVRKLCPDCKEPYRLTGEVAEQYGLTDNKGNPAVMFRPRGCKKCLDIGYKGRIGIVECMRISDKIKQLLFENASEAEIETEARREGMITLRENGVRSVLSGETSLEEVLRVTVESRKLSGEGEVE